MKGRSRGTGGLQTVVGEVSSNIFNDRTGSLPRWCQAPLGFFDPFGLTKAPPMGRDALRFHHIRFVSICESNW